MGNAFPLQKFVPYGPWRSFFDLYELPPSPCLRLPKKSSEVPFSSEGGTFQRLGGPGSSQEKPGGFIKVLWEKLWENLGVLWENKRVMGMLGCP